MTVLLERLFEEYSREEAMRLLRDDALRSTAYPVVAPALEAAGMIPGFLDTDAGRNLFAAVLTLRIRFPIDEARRKVQLNIAMREGRA